METTTKLHTLEEMALSELANDPEDSWGFAASCRAHAKIEDALLQVLEDLDKVGMSIRPDSEIWKDIQNAIKQARGKK